MALATAPIDGGKRTPRPLRALKAPPVHGSDLRDPAYQAYLILRLAFVVAPILFGIDKFFNRMTPWSKYLWVGIYNNIPGSAQHIMDAIGAVEITAGVLVFLVPRVAPYVVTAWLGGIVTDLILKSVDVGGLTAVYWDIALRDFGLMLAALALGRLAAAFAPAPWFLRGRSKT